MIANCFVLLQRWLKPGGRVLISDYCCSEGDHSQVFKDYISTYGYNFLTIANYGKVTSIIIYLLGHNKTKRQKMDSSPHKHIFTYTYILL